MKSDFALDRMGEFFVHEPPIATTFGSFHSFSNHLTSSDHVDASDRQRGSTYGELGKEMAKNVCLDSAHRLID